MWGVSMVPTTFLSIEEETYEEFDYYLKNAGILLSEYALKLQIFRPEPVVTVGIYGANEEYCLVAQAVPRPTPGVISQLKEILDKLRKYAPEKLRPKVILGLYIDIIYPGLEEEARKENIWLIKSNKELVPLKEVLQKL